MPSNINENKTTESFFIFGLLSQMVKLLSLTLWCGDFRAKKEVPHQKLLFRVLNL